MRPKFPSITRQQTGVPSLRSPQAWYPPLLIVSNVSPSGAGSSIKPLSSITSQQMGVPSLRRPHVYTIPLLIDVNVSPVGTDANVRRPAWSETNQQTGAPSSSSLQEWYGPLLRESDGNLGAGVAIEMGVGAGVGVAVAVGSGVGVIIGVVVGSGVGLVAGPVGGGLAVAVGPGPTAGATWRSHPISSTNTNTDTNAKLIAVNADIGYALVDFISRDLPIVQVSPKKITPTR